MSAVASLRRASQVARPALAVHFPFPLSTLFGVENDATRMIVGVQYQYRVAVITARYAGSRRWARIKVYADIRSREEFYAFRDEVYRDALNLNTYIGRMLAVQLSTN